MAGRLNISMPGHVSGHTFDERFGIWAQSNPNPSPSPDAYPNPIPIPIPNPNTNQVSGCSRATRGPSTRTPTRYRYILGRPSHLCVCRVGTSPAR